MPDYTFNIFRIADIGGTNGLELAGEITMRDDDGNRDDTFDDIEQAASGETNGDQQIIASAVTELSTGDTIRTRGIFRFTNDDTGETYDVTEVYSQSAGGPVEQLFILTSTAPDWIFDTTSRSFSLVNSDGTLPYSSIVCFCAGTLITMRNGSEIPVENLKVGDYVRTQRKRGQKVQWVGSRALSPFAVMSDPKLKPVRIRAGALGGGLPRVDLYVSQQHRMQVRSLIAKRIFGIQEVLLPAIKLVGLDGIEIAHEVTEPHYVHFMFRSHQVVYANGAPSESLFTGPEALKFLSDAARAEIEAIMPELWTPDFKPTPAGLIPGKGADINALVDRHQTHQKPLLADL